MKHELSAWPTKLLADFLCLPPIKWGHIFLAMLSVCPSVCPSLCLSVTLSCPLYIYWTASGIFKWLCTYVNYDETIWGMYVLPMSVQSQGQSSRVIPFFCPLFIFWIPGGIHIVFCTNVKYGESMCSAYIWSRFNQCQGHSSRFYFVWLFTFPLL